MDIKDKRIAILAPVAWRTPPRAYGAWETVASNITEGLVKRGWKNITLFAEKTILLGIKSTADSFIAQSKVRLPYRVKNLLIEPGIGLPVVLEIDVIIK